MPILNRYRDSSWLTVGDGRFGLDAIRLKKLQPALKVLPTDISTALLTRAKDKKLRVVATIKRKHFFMKTIIGDEDNRWI